MNGHNFQFEEYHIPEAASHVFQCFNLMIGSFLGSRRDSIILIREDSGSERGKGFGRLQRHFNTGGLRSFDPIG